MTCPVGGFSRDTQDAASTPLRGRRLAEIIIDLKDETPPPAGDFTNCGPVAELMAPQRRPTHSKQKIAV